jgi:hypothetical protein
MSNPCLPYISIQVVSHAFPAVIALRSLFHRDHLCGVKSQYSIDVIQ